MSKTKRTTTLQAELDHLVGLGYAGIDIIDIPEAPAKNWMNAKR